MLITPLVGGSYPLKAGFLFYMIKQCKVCGKEFYTIPSKIRIGKGKFCSTQCYYISKKGIKTGKMPEKTRKKISKAQKGKPRPYTSNEKHWMWKGDNASYCNFHKWLVKHYGKANKCENPNCKYKNPKRYEWALKKEYKHSHNINHYIQLCSSCHRKYDFTEKTREKMIYNATKSCKKRNRNEKGQFI